MRQLIDEVLARPTEEGLFALLDEATELMDRDPAAASRLADLCATTAATIDAGATVLPRVRYLQAEAHAVDGDFPAALALTEQARLGWVAIGEDLKALRTGLTKMYVLNELGRHAEALRIGEALLAALQDLPTNTSSAEVTRIRAGAHHNLGISQAYAGRYRSALAAYDAAEREYRAIGSLADVAELQHNRGVELLSLGRVTAAVSAFEDAVSSFRASGQVRFQGNALSELGRARLLLGDYLLGLQDLQAARALLEPLDASVDYDRLMIATGETYLALNLYDEALATYRAVEPSLRAAGMTLDLAATLSGAGAALMGAGRLREAEEALTEAGRRWEEAGNTPELAGALLERAAVLDRMGDRAAALVLARDALARLRGSEWRVQLVYAHLRVADLLLPSLDEVEGHLLAARRIAEHLPLPHLRYRLNQRLGHLRLLQGTTDEAERLLTAAVDEIERLRGALTQEAMRASFLRDKAAAYADLLRLHLDRGDADSLRRAFEVAERAKSRALVDLLAGAVAQQQASGPAEGVSARLRALQADLTAVYNELLGNDGARGRGGEHATLRDRACRLEQAIGVERLRAPADAAPADPMAAPLSLEALHAGLPADLTVLAYHLLDDEVLAFVSRDGRLWVVRDVSTVGRIQPLVARLAAQWQRFRAGREFTQRHAPRLAAATQRLLAALHDELVAPVLPLLEATPAADGRPSRLAVVPHGVLHQVPFHALTGDRGPLLERFDISVAPSATVLGLSSAIPAAHTGRALVMGVATPDLPAVAGEARAVASNLPSATLRLGEAATVAALRAEAPGSDVVHLACHGLFRAENPMLSALRFHDGWLTATDALELDLRGALVALSACESGRSRVLDGGDEVIGLTRAFLAAGASALLVSLWLVQDDTTAELMTRWYQLVRDGLGAAPALRAAQLELRQRHPHPYHWAPFVIVGSPSSGEETP